MKETLLVKHAVGGRTLIDSSKLDVVYRVEKVEAGWLFSLNVPFDAVVEDILNWKDELNVFLFHESEGEPTKKTWFYVKDNPVKYDLEKHCLTIVAEAHIEYVPERFRAT
ncbi:hypothetical protein [Brevibacillus choshinensis]|uniref:hypothetical protein n=1 Tax=Brevibacillus choshinensis TaxID=54911 RepID=UPI002E220E60|nr:hypothetical protein [Brevibacillus choshinensis]